MLKLFGFLCLLGVTLSTPSQTEGVFEDVQAAPKEDGRIVGGQSTTIDKFPYQISLQLDGRHFGAGSVISPEWVLTAAHCVNIAAASAYTVRAGTSTPNSGGTVYDIATIISHPSYNYKTMDYDIAVIRISGTFKFGFNVRAIELAKSAPSPDTDAVVTGWGYTTENGITAAILQYVHVPVVSNSLCNHYNSKIYSITDRMMCAGFLTGDKDACQGDSGGPLVSGGVQVGVVSWGHGCARPNYLGVYTSVTNMRSWINNNTGV